MKKPHRVYETKAPGGKRYVGYTQSKPGETGREAVDDRLGEHISKKDGLGQQIKANPERAKAQTSIRSFKTKEAALKAEEARKNEIPAHKRINK